MLTNCGCSISFGVLLAIEDFTVIVTNCGCSISFGVPLAIEDFTFTLIFILQCKWSRKGFMRTRWRVNGTEVDLVNIHLFHDASNFVAMKQVYRVAIGCRLLLMVTVVTIG